MKRLLGYALSACFFATLGVSTACEHNDQSMFLSHVLAPPENCQYTADQESYLPSGVVDVALASEYRPTFLAGNQLIARSDRTTVRAESNRITLKGAVVSVSYATGEFLGEFTSLSSGTLDPATSDVHYAAITLTVLDQNVIKKLREALPNRGASRTVVARVKAFGTTIGGKDVESNEFEFPIVATNGGLVRFPPDAEDPNQPRPNCLLARSSQEQKQKICVLGQDQTVDCRDCIGIPACQP
jgi:hypothetical protein